MARSGDGCSKRPRLGVGRPTTIQTKQTLEQTRQSVSCQIGINTHYLRVVCDITKLSFDLITRSLFTGTYLKCSVIYSAKAYVVVNSLGVLAIKRVDLAISVVSADYQSELYRVRAEPVKTLDSVNSK